MRQVKRKIYSGVVLEQIVYCVSDRTGDSPREAREAAPRLRFKSEAERAEHRRKISRQRHVRAFNANFDEGCLYATLTFDDSNEVHSATEMRMIRQRYIRRLRYHYPDAVIFFYYGRGASTHRFHAHMVSRGIPASEISRLWGYGKIERVESLRRQNFYKINGVKVNCGQDYTALANYLFDHWEESFGGHRYYATRNARTCDREEAAVVRRLYSVDKPPATPKGYMLVECYDTSYGYGYYRYAKIPADERRRQ